MSLLRGHIPGPRYEGGSPFFPHRKCGGPLGTAAQNLLDCLNSADSAVKMAMLEALLTLITTVVAVRLHPCAAPHLCAARHIPLRKKEGCVRPIAVSDTLRRLTA